MIKRAKAFVKSTPLLLKIYRKITWKIHLFIDWYDTKTKSKITVDHPLGFKFTAGVHPAYELMRMNAFEVDETMSLRSHINTIDRFIDVGANVGYYSCIALSSGTPVVAFEPQFHNLEYLAKNVSDNDWGENIEIFPLGLTERCSVLSIYGASGPSASILKNWAGYSPRNEKKIYTATLDRMIGKAYAGEKLFIKIDVEGTEYNVLKGATDTLRRNPKPIWLIEICFDEFHPDGENPRFYEIFSIFRDHGYRAAKADSSAEELDLEEIDQIIQQEKQRSKSLNYLFF